MLLRAVEPTSQAGGGASRRSRAEPAKEQQPQAHSLAAKRLESPDPAGTDAAMHPPAAAMQQSPDSMENAGQARPQRWLGHRPQRMVYEFARPVFRRCGWHLRAEKMFSNGEYKCFRIKKIGFALGSALTSRNLRGVQGATSPAFMGRNQFLILPPMVVWNFKSFVVFYLICQADP